MLIAANIHLGEKAESLVRRVLILILAAVVLASAGGTATAGKAGKAVRIGYYAIDPSGFKDKLQNITAEIVNDTLSQQFERQFDQEAGLYAYVERLYEPLGVNRQNAAAVAKALERQERILVFKYGFEIVVVADLSIEEGGYLVRVNSVDLRPGPGKIDWRGTPSLAVLQARPNFVDVKKEMEAIGRRIARRFTGLDKLPTAQERLVTPVLFWCIQSANPKDRELSHISRRLTLELPFFLREHRHDLPERFDFTGMSARDYIGECLERGFGGSDPRRPYLDFDRYTYVVSGQAEMDRNRAGDPMVIVKYLFDWRTEGYGIPQLMPGISLELDVKSLDKTAQTFLRIFSTTLRRELVKSAQANLSALGFYKARVDGVLGPETKAAIKTFQEKFGLKSTGTITPELVATLRRMVKRGK